MKITDYEYVRVDDEQLVAYFTQLPMDNGEKSLHRFLGLSAKQRPNFSERQLSYFNFQNADFEGANFEGAKCMLINLKDSNLRHTNLKFAQLGGAVGGSSFPEVRATLEGADLYQADMEGADLNLVNLAWVNFTGANLKNINLAGATVTYANFISAKNLSEELRHALAEEQAITTPEALLEATQNEVISPSLAYRYVVSVSHYATTLENGAFKTRCMESAAACISFIRGLPATQQPEAYKLGNKDFYTFLAHRYDKGSLLGQLPPELVGHIIGDLLAMRKAATSWSHRIEQEWKEQQLSTAKGPSFCLIS